MQVNRKGDYIETLSGIRFYPLDPRPDEFLLDDMCHAVSREQRFGNHTQERYSVGQHLLMCAKFAKDSGFSPYIQFLAATHDLQEAYVRDLPSPIKHSFIYYRQVEDRILHVLWHQYFQIREPLVKEIELLKYCDGLLCAAEAIELGINKTNWVENLELANDGYVDHSDPPETGVRDSLKSLITALYQQLIKDGDSIAS